MVDEVVSSEFWILWGFFCLFIYLCNYFSDYLFISGSIKELTTSIFLPLQLCFLGVSCFLYVEILSTSVQQIKNFSDCLTLFLLSSLLMLSWFSGSEGNHPWLSPCCIQFCRVDPLSYQVRTIAVYTHLSHRQLNTHGSKE